MVEELLAFLQGAWLVDLGGLFAKVEFLGQQLDQTDPIERRQEKGIDG